MTTIQNIPEEILVLIFKQLEPYEMKKCQRVCRAWYPLAHTIFLSQVMLLRSSEASKFIKSIDYNPSSSYLNAVKEIDVSDRSYYYDDAKSELQFDKDLLKKLFFRFPNLTDVTISNFEKLIDLFDHEICIEFINCCPKLKRFEVHITDSEDDAEQFYSTMYRLRLLLTTLDIRKIDSTPLPQGVTVVQFVTQFPRLRTLSGPSNQLDNFEKFLPIFSQLAYLNRITLSRAINDRPNFLEHYLLQKTKEEEKELIDRLSKIAYLSLYYRTNFCANSLSFIIKYLVGLKAISLITSLQDALDDLQEKLLFNDFLNFTCSIENRSEIFLRDLTPEVLPKYIPSITNSKVFSEPVDKKYGSKVMQVLIVEKRELESNQSNIKITVEGTGNLKRRLFDSDYKSEASRDLVVIVSASLKLDQILHNLLGDATKIDNIDVLKIEADKNGVDWCLSRGEVQPYTEETTIEMYDKFIERMPSVKKVVFEVPESYVENINYKGDSVYPGIQDITFQTTGKTNFQSLLDGYAQRLPNLKNLNLYYSSGEWNDRLKEFQIRLPSYSLENIVLDLTPSSAKMKENAMTRLTADKFFIIELELLSGHQHRFYKLSFDPSKNQKLIQSEISKDDLKVNDGKGNHVRIHIVVENFRRLDLYLWNGFPGEFRDKKYMNDPEILFIPHSTIYNEDQKV